MQPIDQDQLATTAELFERYAVRDPDERLEPEVAACVAARPQLAREIDAGLTLLRQQLLPERMPVPIRRGAMEGPPRISRFVGSGRGTSERTLGYNKDAVGVFSLRSVPRGIFSRIRVPMLYLGAIAILVATLPAIREMSLFTSRRNAPTIKEYRTTVGQRARVTLPDNSTIVLGPNSRVRYSSTFGTSNNRTIMLEGQGLFTVTHVLGTPFVVQTAGVSTRVLGTSFLVRRYAADTALQVVVAQGKVMVGQSVLGAGDIATARGAHDISVSRGNAISEQLAWTEGRLDFTVTPLRDVLPELQRWYGVTVTVADPALLERPVTTTLDIETMARALDLVAFAVGGRVEVRGQHAVIFSR